MAIQYNGFKASNPVVRRIGRSKFEVFFCYYIPEKKVFRYKKGINSLPADERRDQAIALASEFKEALKNGWNPSLSKLPIFDFSEEDEIITFESAIDKALAEKKKILSKFSYYDYDGAGRFFKAAAAVTGHLKMDIGTIKKADIKNVLNMAVELNKWSAKSRNKNLERLRSLLSVIVDDEKIDHNPAYGIKDLPVIETGGYKRLTDEQQNEIAAHLVKYPDYFDYLICIYQLGIRRTELLQIRIGDIDFLRREIVVQGSAAKMNRLRKLPITDEILKILMRREVRSFNKNWYLFSQKFKPGEGPLHPNTATNWWQKLVQQELGIDCKMYSLKHKGADDYIMAGVAIDALQQLYGHKSKQMTEVYARAVKQKYNQAIIQMSPSFSKEKKA